MVELISHMICAPEFDGAGRVTEWHVAAGDWVAHDGKLASVAWEDGVSIVHAPGAGSVSALMVALGDEVGSGELLLMMEIEEDDGSWLPADLPAACATASYTPPAVQSTSPSAEVLQVSRAAATLAARLGVDLGLVNAADGHGVIDSADVERYVRQRLSGQ